jgi:hypothetical protein
VLFVTGRRRERVEKEDIEFFDLPESLLPATLNTNE